jgi:hypothetical protein
MLLAVGIEMKQSCFPVIARSSCDEAIHVTRAQGWIASLRSQ